MTPHKGAVRARHSRKALAVPHLFSHILTQVAVALIEAALIRLCAELWKAFTGNGGPATATA